MVAIGDSPLPTLWRPTRKTGRNVCEPLTCRQFLNLANLALHMIHPASESIPAATPRSSCAPDTILTGANYLKGQPPVVSLADDAYPEWLWDVLKPKVYEDDGPGGKKERMERRKANRQSIKDRNFMQTQ